MAAPQQASGRAPGCLVDTHSHLNHPRLLKQIEQVLARARQAGVSEMLVVGYDLPSSQKAVELAQQHEGLWAAVGVHPHDAADFGTAELIQLHELAQSPQVVAIGETGLDFYRNLSPREAQETAFRHHLELASELQRPVIVHCREAQEAVLDTLDGYTSTVVWHCFDGNWEQAARALELGLMLGFGGRITYRAAEELRSIAARVPRERILLETDCPYLAPESMRNHDNEPANLTVIAEWMAKVRREEVAELVAVTAANARRVFGLPD